MLLPLVLAALAAAALVAAGRRDDDTVARVIIWGGPACCAFVLGLRAVHRWTVPVFALVVGLGGGVLTTRVYLEVHPYDGTAALGYLFLPPPLAVELLAVGVVAFLVRLVVGAHPEPRPTTEEPPSPTTT